LVAAATQVNIVALEARAPTHPSLSKYANVGRLLTGRDDLDDQAARSALIALLAEWSERLELPRLNRYGIGSEDFALIVANSRGSSMLTNPIVLEDGEIEAILTARL